MGSSFVFTRRDVPALRDARFVGAGFPDFGNLAVTAALTILLDFFTARLFVYRSVAGSVRPCDKSKSESD